MKDPVRVVFTIDKNYTQQLVVAATSLLLNTRSQVYIYIVHNGLGLKNYLLILISLIFRNCKLKFLKIDHNSVVGLHVNKHVSLATYYRILLPEVLPQDINKVIFLDADIVVQGDIQELYAKEITQYSCAAVQNPNMSETYLEKLNLTPKQYFNAGVLLINLKYWRDEKVSESVLEFLEQEGRSFDFWDQDGLNRTLKGSWLPLHPEWNLTHVFYMDEEVDDTFNRQEVYEARNQPKIIHFSGGGINKPWNSGCSHKFKEIYFRYLMKTLWRMRFLLKG